MSAARVRLKRPAVRPDIPNVSTASGPGQNPAATPVAPRTGRAAGVVPGVAVLAVAVLLAVLVVSEPPRGVVLGAGGLAVVLAVQLLLWRRQHRLAAALQRSQDSLRTLVGSSADPVVILDDSLRITFVSGSSGDLLGLDAAALPGTRIADLIHPEDRADLFGPLEGGSAVRTARVRQADGRWRLVQATVRDLRDNPDVGGLVLHCRDVSPSAPAPGADSELLELALTDAVTGLPNRTALVRRLGGVQRGPRNRAVSMALIGVSGWDPGLLSPGEEATVLRALTSRLTRALRGEDWLARTTEGGFVVLVEGSIADAEIVAARLIATVTPLATASGTLPLTAAAGVSELSRDVDPGESLRRVDLALNSARRAGGGSVHRYDDALRTELDRRSALRADLDGALSRGELRVVFQPVVDAVLHRTVTVEALLRWQHPVFGEVSPVEFVPLAEESALISEVGRWVLREACRAVASVDDELAVAVNVSARQVRGGELVPDVLAALEDSGLPPSRLLVEITESVLLDDAHVIEDLGALRTLGVRIAVDDFGTGWSSLAYLVGMPVDVLKMDQYFLADVEHDPARRAMCRAVLQLGSSLDLPVIVEGVNTPATLALLRDMGHRYLQGYLLSRPLEADQLATGVAVAADALRTAPAHSA